MTAPVARRGRPDKHGTTGEAKPKGSVSAGGGLVSQSLRELIREAVTEDATLESVRQMIADAFATAQATKVSCPECSHRFVAAVPDVVRQVQTMISLLEQSEGKAEQKPSEATTVVVVRPPLD